MRDYFCGWYFKCQSDSATIALIPAYHQNAGVRTCSVQVITDSGAFSAVYPANRYREDKDGFAVCVGDSRFSKSSIHININEPNLSVTGNVNFGKFSPIRYDIMGPFKFVPFMECRHSVKSMRHSVIGEITVNKKTYSFDAADGYIEGDRGYSFPNVYAWTHCFFDEGSLMLSVAEIPIGAIRFTGIIGVVMLGGKEYRIATYLGAKAEKIGGGEIVVKQGNLRLTARLLSERSHALSAPSNGAMTRTIHESAACRAYYRFEKSGQVLLSEESDRASFEYEYDE